MSVKFEALFSLSSNTHVASTWMQKVNFRQESLSSDQASHILLPRDVSMPLIETVASRISTLLDYYRTRNYTGDSHFLGRAVGMWLFRYGEIPQEKELQEQGMWKIRTIYLNDDVSDLLCGDLCLIRWDLNQHSMVFLGKWGAGENLFLSRMGPGLHLSIHTMLQICAYHTKGDIEVWRYLV